MRPVHNRRRGPPVVLVDDFAFEARDAAFHDAWSNGADPHNVRPPRSRTDHRADPTGVPLARVQARHQGLRFSRVDAGGGRSRRVNK